MIILIWTLSMTILIVGIGEIKYRFFDKKEKARERRILGTMWKESTEAEMGNLSIEHTSDEFVPAETLAMRGSWRLAQGKVMGKSSFQVLKMQEYKKML